VARWAGFQFLRRPHLRFLQYLENELTAKGFGRPFTKTAAMFNDARWINDPTAPTTVPGPPRRAAARASAARADGALLHAAASLPLISRVGLAKAAAALSADRRTILATGVTMRVLSHGGSNAIAVSPSRSADGHALLWGAPQEGFGTPSVDGEEYLRAPGYRAGGMYITGEPFILIGRNSTIAWTTTSEELVDQRIYIEHNVNYAASPPTYEFNGQQVPMQAIPETIEVAGQPPVSFTVLRTIDGPVVLADPADHLAISVRFASWDQETGSLTGFSQLGGDANLSQFRHSMSLITTLHNFLYADRKGNIAYFGDGLVPIEPSGVDPRLPGAGDGTQQWTGFVPFAQMPHSVNPRQGFLDNWEHKALTGGLLPAELRRRVLGHDLPFPAHQPTGPGQYDDERQGAGRHRAHDRHHRQRGQHPARGPVLHPVAGAGLQQPGAGGRPDRGPGDPPGPAPGGERTGALGRGQHARQPGDVDLHELPGGLRAQRVRGRAQPR
jgi:acyl-homoserine lactone acylase PvdQ